MDDLGTMAPYTVRALIDTDAIAHNVRTLTTRLAPVDLMCVVKAEAYGHGMDAVVPACVDAGARSFGVATVPEALRLHALLTELGVREECRVLVWLYDPRTDLAPVIAAGIELALARPGGLAQIVEAAERAGTTARVHLKIDTGLGRNGLTVVQVDQVLDDLASLAESEEAPRLWIVGVMTHYANADEPADRATGVQTFRFNTAVSDVTELLESTHGRLGDPEGLCVHSANSPASLSLDPVPGTMARVGLSLYGLSPFADRTSAELGLRPAMTLASRVLTVKNVRAGHGASYGLTYRTPKDTRFALVAGGYGDGVPRAASNRAEVWVAGRRFPVVGRIAMDQMILDVGDAEVAPGDEAILFGPADGAVAGAGDPYPSEPYPTAEDWGTWSDSINYEVVTRVSPRVSRVVVPTNHSNPSSSTPPVENHV